MLSELGVEFLVRPSFLPEDVGPGEEPLAYCRRLAREKALAVAANSPGHYVLGSDTVVVLDGEILSKPVDEEDARGMLRRLSGREHFVVTAVALVGADGALVEVRHEQSTVQFRRLRRDEIERYVASGEPLDKAGAYAIQGGAADFVTRLQGAYENVVGLPLETVRSMLEGVGLYPPRVGR